MGILGWSHFPYVKWYRTGGLYGIRREETDLKDRCDTYVIDSVSDGEIKMGRIWITRDGYKRPTGREQKQEEFSEKQLTGDPKWSLIAKGEGHRRLTHLTRLLNAEDKRKQRADETR